MAVDEADLGAALVESTDPLWTPDPDVETMKTDFRRALARLAPVFMPDLLFRLARDGQPLFPEFAPAIVSLEVAHVARTPSAGPPDVKLRWLCGGSGFRSALEYCAW